MLIQCESRLTTLHFCNGHAPGRRPRRRVVVPPPHEDLVLQPGHHQRRALYAPRRRARVVERDVEQARRRELVVPVPAERAHPVDAAFDGHRACVAGCVGGWDVKTFSEAEFNTEEIEEREEDGEDEAERDAGEGAGVRTLGDGTCNAELALWNGLSLCMSEERSPPGLRRLQG
jgi:hypothetical protein